jgi:PAS domain S-box-containing protein
MGQMNQSKVDLQTDCVCTVTGVPIYSRPEWTEVHLDSGYTLTLSILGEGILYNRPTGYCTLHGLRNAVHLIDEVVGEVFPGDRPYVQIEDYSNLYGVSLEGRRYFIDDMRNRKRLLGLIFCCASPVFRMGIKMGKRLNLVRFNVEMVKDYPEAVNLALELHSRNKRETYESFRRETAPGSSPSSEDQLSSGAVTRPDWSLDLPEYSVQFEVIDGDIIHSESKGFINTSHVAPLAILRDRIIESVIPRGGTYYFAVGVGKVGGGSRDARKIYMDSLKDTYRTRPFALYVFYGANRAVQAAANLARPFMPFKLRVAKDLKSALRLIADEKRGKNKEPPYPSARPPAFWRPGSRKIHGYVSELLQYLASINWESDGLDVHRTTDPSHPFGPVFDALALIKGEIDELFKERSQTEKALKESEQKFRDIFNNVSDFLYSHDLEGNLIETNLVWRKELGYSEEDLAGLNGRNLLPESLKGQFDLYLKRVREHGNDKGLMRVIAKDGHERTVEYKNSMVHDSDGRPLGIRGSARDITERIEAERVLKESEEKHRTILENMEEGYYEVDLKGNFTFFNESMCTILGFSRNELMGMNYRAYMDEKNANMVYQKFNKVFTTGKPDKGFDYQDTKKDGSKCHIESSLALMVNRSGQPIGFRGVVRDITPRKQAEEEIRRYSGHLEEMVQERTEALRQSEEKYRTILENLEDAYYELDLAGRLTFFNDALCRIAGYSRDELTGADIYRYTPPEKCRPVIEAYRMVYETGRPARRIEWEMTASSGASKFMENSASLIRDSGGRPTGFRGIIRDVTERKLLEQEIITKGRLAEDASKAKSEFLAHMSHEIRTPLNGIIGMAELAMDTDLDSDQQEIFENVYTEANSLLGLINDILDFSKIEARKLQMEEVPFDLGLLMEELGKKKSLKARQKGLEFTMGVAPDVPSLVVGDPGRLRQIITNLVGNALKFTPKGEISLRGEVAKDLGETVKIRFVVKDTGIGIPKDKQANIFEGFTQADNSTTRKYGGTGLGTTIAKQLAVLMGGEIGLESEEGRGSTFWFTAVFRKQKPLEAPCGNGEIDLKGLKVLAADDHRDAPPALRAHPDSHCELMVGSADPQPAEDLVQMESRGVEDTDAPKVVAGSARAADSHREVRILVTEDYPTNQQVFMRFLKNAGYKADLAANGREAVDACATKHYDLILMDIQMPDMDGYQATKAIREREVQSAEKDCKNGRRGLFRVPIVAMTAHAISGYRESCLAAGMDDYLTKPVGKKALMAMVEKWTASRPEQDREGHSDVQVIDEEVQTENREGLPMDLEKAVQEFEGDRPFLMDVLEGFRSKARLQIQTIRRAISTGDAKELSREAHAIKGGAANLTASELSRIALELENIGKSGVVAGGEEALVKLENAFSRFEDYVTGL